MLNFFKTKTFKVGSLVVAFALALALTASAMTFSGPTLRQGSKGGEVAAMQTLVGATADGNFGPMTKAAVMAWQASNGLTADGIFGAMSMAKANGGSTVGSGSTGALCPNGMTLASNCMTAPGAGTGALCPNGMTLASNCMTAPAGGTTGVLTGGAGSIDSYRLVTNISNEEVGEGQSDIDVAGLEIENSDDSDISIKAVQLVFTQGTADNDDFHDYADNVTISVDGIKVASVDAKEFTEDNSYTKTVSVNSNVIKAGADAEITVAVSAENNIDSADLTETWTVDFSSIRYMDGQGTVISEDPSTGVRTFSFESSAVSANTEFKITKGNSDDVNDAHVIDIHATEETQNVAVLQFDVEIKGDADVALDDLPVNFTVGGAQDHVDEMVAGITLMMDDKEVSSINMGSDGVEDPDGVSVGTSETYVFTDMDLILKAGKTYTFKVLVDIYGITDTGDVAAGDTILATFGETQTDLSSFDASALGEDLVGADVVGTVTSSASEVRDIAFNVKLVSTNAVLSHAGDIANTNDHDEGTFTITFDVEAFGGDIYIDATKPDETGGTTEADLDVVGTDTYIDSNITSPTGATLSGTINADARFLVEEDTTERFTITFVTAAGADGLFQVSLTDIRYALTDVSGTTSFTFGLEDFDTPSLSMQYDA